MEAELERRWWPKTAGRVRSLSRQARVFGSRLRQRGAAWLRLLWPSESQHLFALTLAVGVVCGFVAVAFHLAIQAAERLLIERAMHAPGSSWVAWTIASPVLGGLAAGALLTWVVPGARGSGIPQVKAAFAIEGGRIPLRDAVGKFCVAVLQIGSGASLGREGPTVQICAGATSLLARLTALPAKNMRRLLPVGVAAGIAAAFNAPVAAVTFTIEEIVGALDHAVLSGVVVAAALAAVIERGVLGVHPIIEVHQTYGLDHPSSLALYALLGVAGGLVSIAFTDALLRLRLAFRQSTAFPRWAQPGLGGLVTGVLAVLVMAMFGATGATGGGYHTLGEALEGKLSLELLLVLGVVKLLATVFSYSSGGAGGIFAPALFVGAMLGGAVGYLDVALLHHESHQLGAFALVGMGAVFAGVIRAPMTSVLIIFEMTGGYGLVLPLMLANMTAYVIARHYRATPVYEALLLQDGVVLPRVSARGHALDHLRVADAMSNAVVTVSSLGTVGEAMDAVADKSFHLVPAVDARGTLVGTISLAALRSAPRGEPLSRLLEKVETVLADAPLARAMVQMNDRGVRQLVVLDEQTAARVVGVLTMTDVIRTHARALGTGQVQPAASVATDRLDEVRARALARPAPVVAADAPLDTLLDAFVQAPGGALVVQGPDGKTTGVVLIEQLTDFLRDERLRRMLVAADLVLSVPLVAAETALPELIRACAAEDAPALLVASEGGTEAVITKSAIGAALIAWHARSDAG